MSAACLAAVHQSLPNCFKIFQCQLDLLESMFFMGISVSCLGTSRETSCLYCYLWRYFKTLAWACLLPLCHHSTLRGTGSSVTTARKSDKRSMHIRCTGIHYVTGCIHYMHTYTTYHHIHNFCHYIMLYCVICSDPYSYWHR